MPLEVKERNSDVTKKEESKRGEASLKKIIPPLLDRRGGYRG